MCAFKEEERSVLVSVTSMKGSAGFKSNYANFWHLVLYVCEGPNICDSQRLERKISFLFYLFIFFFCHPHFSLKLKVRVEGFEFHLRGNKGLND